MDDTAALLSGDPDDLMSRVRSETSNYLATRILEIERKAARCSADNLVAQLKIGKEFEAFQTKLPDDLRSWMIAKFGTHIIGRYTIEALWESPDTFSVSLLGNPSLAPSTLVH